MGAREFLAAVQARAEAATDGPWSHHDFGHAGEQEPSSIAIHTGRFDWTDLRDPEGTSAVAWMAAWDLQESRNAEFIAAARTDVPRLVAALTAGLDHTKHPMVYTDEYADGYNAALRDIRAVIEGALTNGDDE